MIVIDDNIVAIWFMPTADQQDWLCAISEIEPDKKYKIVYRFRYHVDEKNPFESDDRKSWYEGSFTGTRHYAISSMREVVKTMWAATGRGPHKTWPYEIVKTGTLEEFTKKYLDAPFVFVKEISKEEAEREGLRERTDIPANQA
jgi:hypothetical protein